MSKRALVLIVLIISVPSFLFAQQHVFKVKADSASITNAEFILENRTKDTLGFLFNRGNGRTEFRRALIPISSKKYLIGLDTLSVSGGGNWGAITGTLSDQSDLQNALNNRLTKQQADTLYAALIHTHTISNINGLQTALNKAYVSAQLLADSTGFKLVRPDGTFDTFNFIGNGSGNNGNTATLPVQTTTNVTEGSNLYYTNARARSAIALSNNGSGAATYDNSTGIFNIPQYPTGSSGWGLTGNSINPATDFIGTKTSNSFRIRTNNFQRMVVDSIGIVGIGTQPTDANNFYILQVANTGRFETRSATPIRIGVAYNAIGGTTDFYGIESGNNLIGTTSSGTSLVLKANTGGVDIYPYYSSTLPKMKIWLYGVGIGDNTAASTNTILNINSTNQGVLFPRLTTTQRDAIPAPLPEGLEIYNLTVHQKQYYNGTTWVSY